jgi:hypothetical protein
MTARDRRRAARLRARLKRVQIRKGGLRGSQLAQVRAAIRTGYAKATKNWKRCDCGRWKPCRHCALAKLSRIGDRHRRLLRLGVLGDLRWGRRARRAERRRAQQQKKYQRRRAA